MGNFTRTPFKHTDGRFGGYQFVPIERLEAVTTLRVLLPVVARYAGISHPSSAPEDIRGEIKLPARIPTADNSSIWTTPDTPKTAA
jgi:hypothetical protein